MSDSKDLLNGLPYPIGINVIKAMSRYDRSEFAADIAIGNIPWLMAPNDEHPFTRVTTPFQRERVDQAATAGEQSLSNWWVRSATSWHRGAGITYYDAEDDDLYRFRESDGIDIWTQGQLSLLPATTQVAESEVEAAATSESGVWFASEDKLWHIAEGDSEPLEIAGVPGCHNVCSDGSAAFVAAYEGIYKVTHGDWTVTLLYSSPSPGWAVHSMGYVKDRLIVCAVVDDDLPARVFELSRNPASPPATVDLVNDSRWESDSEALSFGGVTETTGAILVATNLGVRARVLSFALTTDPDTGLPILAPAITVAELPTGEVIRTIGSYLNSYVVLGTNRGLRVGIETDNGVGFTYGPRVVEDDVYGLAFDGEYIYASRNHTLRGKAGLWRIHLGTEVGDSYAYAADLATSGDDVHAVAFLGSSGMAFIGGAGGAWVQSTALVEDGYLISGRIRFGTSERKQAVAIASLAHQQYGTVEVTVTNLEGAVASFARQPDGELVNASLSADMRPSSENEVTIELNRGASDDPTPIFDEWQLRALPAPMRSRTITLPLLCYVSEKDANDASRVSDPWDRVKAMEYLEQTGGSCLYQNFGTGEERVVVIRGVQYDQTAPPSFTQPFGGLVTIQLQTVDTEVF